MATSRLAIRVSADRGRDPVRYVLSCHLAFGWSTAANRLEAYVPGSAFR